MPTVRQAQLWALEDFFEDYADLMEMGETKQDALRRLNVSQESAEKRFKKAGRYIPERKNWATYVAIWELLHRGKPWTINDIPLAFGTGEDIATCLMACETAKYIKSTGKVSDIRALDRKVSTYGRGSVDMPSLGSVFRLRG
ncbi:hypothetical protein CJ179_38805 [Rhodococcus sp. ACS1]|uniref:hypothetical protein n=1 Tax=Rhodococcus sp. ACS1 TaxID=2028570 RepID=UPI000BB15B85|nr:hypothetical protein [Rhodococcus sp. ACS1]PBC38549.1 hypothetical protein CJ179_38805 [Rhodococcus sp. ACS1]